MIISTRALIILSIFVGSCGVNSQNHRLGTIAQNTSVEPNKHGLNLLGDPLEVDIPDLPIDDPNLFDEQTEEHCQPMDNTDPFQLPFDVPDPDDFLPPNEDINESTDPTLDDGTTAMNSNLILRISSLWPQLQQGAKDYVSKPLECLERFLFPTAQAQELCTVVGLNTFSGDKRRDPVWDVQRVYKESDITVDSGQTDLQKARQIMKAVCTVGNSAYGNFTPPTGCSVLPAGQRQLACTRWELESGSIKHYIRGIVKESEGAFRFPTGEMNNVGPSPAQSAWNVYQAAPAFSAGQTSHAKINVVVRIPKLTSTQRTLLNSVDQRLAQIVDKQIASIKKHEELHAEDLETYLAWLNDIDSDVSVPTGSYATKEEAKTALKNAIKDAAIEAKAWLNDQIRSDHCMNTNGSVNIECRDQRDADAGMAPIQNPDFPGLHCDGAQEVYSMPM